MNKAEAVEKPVIGETFAGTEVERIDLPRDGGRTPKPPGLRLSIIIPTRDRPDDLVVAVASIFRQTRLPDELLIVDQSADDRSERNVRNLYDRAPRAVREAVELRYFRRPEIHGVSAARNFALERARGDIWSFHDDDVVLEPEYTERILEVYANDPTVTGVSGVITNYPRPPLLFRLWRRVFELGPFRDERQPVYWRAHEGRAGTELVRVRKFTGLMMSFRASILRGYRCDDSRPGGPRDEDVDFCFGLGPQKLVIAPQARIEHRHSPLGRPKRHWTVGEAEGARALYHRYWRGNLYSALCLAWLLLGYRGLRVWGGLKTAATAAARHWPWLAVGGLALWLYAPVLAGLVTQWWQDPNYSHGFLIPVVSGWLIWSTRDRWKRLPWRPANGALALVALAIALLLAATLAAELFVSRISLLLLLAGAIAFVFGWRRLRAWAFPLGFLLFMVPLPAIIYYQITFPLQLLASRLASFSLDLLQIPALREGNVIQLPNYTMSVAEACSGIRSLISLLALAVAYGYFREPRVWKRVLLAALMVPIAIVSNSFRILGTGVLTYYFGPRYAEGFFHAFSGWLIFLVAMALMLLVHRWLAAWPPRRFRRGAPVPCRPLHAVSGEESSC